MDNVLTLKREIIGDSSYVPQLKLYDAQGCAVNIDVAAIDQKIMEAIQNVAHRIFQGYQAQAEGKTAQTLAERGLTVEGDKEPISLETAGVDEDWDLLVNLLIAAGASAAVKPPLKRVMDKTTPEQVIELQQIKQKSQAKQKLNPTEDRALQKFNRKLNAALPHFAGETPVYRIETFIRAWLVYNEPMWESIKHKKGQDLNEQETEFFKYCQILALHRQGSGNSKNEMELVENLYK